MAYYPYYGTATEPVSNPSGVSQTLPLPLPVDIQVQNLANVNTKITNTQIDPVVSFISGQWDAIKIKNNAPNEYIEVSLQQSGITLPTLVTNMVNANMYTNTLAIGESNPLYSKIVQNNATLSNINPLPVNALNFPSLVDTNNPLPVLTTGSVNSLITNTDLQSIPTHLTAGITMSGNVTSVITNSEVQSIPTHLTGTNTIKINNLINEAIPTQITGQSAALEITNKPNENINVNIVTNQFPIDSGNPLYTKLVSTANTPFTAINTLQTSIYGTNGEPLGQTGYPLLVNVANQSPANIQTNDNPVTPLNPLFTKIIQDNTAVQYTNPLCTQIVAGGSILGGGNPMNVNAVNLPSQISDLLPLPVNCKNLDLINDNFPLSVKCTNFSTPINDTFPLPVNVKNSIINTNIKFNNNDLNVINPLPIEITKGASVLSSGNVLPVEVFVNGLNNVATPFRVNALNLPSEVSVLNPLPVTCSNFAATNGVLNPVFVNQVNNPTEIRVNNTSDAAGAIPVKIFSNSGNPNGIMNPLVVALNNTHTVNLSAGTNVKINNSTAEAIPVAIQGSVGTTYEIWNIKLTAQNQTFTLPTNPLDKQRTLTILEAQWAYTQGKYEFPLDYGAGGFYDPLDENNLVIGNNAQNLPFFMRTRNPPDAWDTINHKKIVDCIVVEMTNVEGNETQLNIGSAAVQTLSCFRLYPINSKPRQLIYEYRQQSKPSFKITTTAITTVTMNPYVIISKYFYPAGQVINESTGPLFQASAYHAPFETNASSSIQIVWNSPLYVKIKCEYS